MSLSVVREIPRSIRLVLPYPPSANRYWRIYHGRAVTSEEAQRYKQMVGILCRASRMRPLSGPVALVIDVHRPAKRGDLDNCLKVLLDALQGHMYIDDGQVTSLVARRHEDAASPRAVVAAFEANP